MSDNKIIPIAKPWLDEREIEAIKRPLLSGWVTQGPEVAAFEREFAKYTGSEHACAVSSCTTALHLALLVVGVKPGDEVITVSHSFIAGANVIRYCGATPVFVDIQAETYNMYPGLVEEAITERTKVILCVHQIGMPCDLQAIVNIAQRFELPVIEDAACAIGSEILWNDKWEKIGRPHGQIACFSFHPRKVLTTGDGGMITTNNSVWDQQFRELRQHGMSIPDTVRHEAKRVVNEAYNIMGYNYRLTDLQASVGREQLKRIPEMIERRRLLADRYRTLLADLPELTLPYEPEWAKSNWQSFCVRLPEKCDQYYVMQQMLDAGISTRRGIMCAHREPAYQKESWRCNVGKKGCNCPTGSCIKLQVSEQIQDQCIILPLYHQMTFDEQDKIIMTLDSILKQSNYKS